MQKRWIVKTVQNSENVSLNASSNSSSHDNVSDVCCGYVDKPEYKDKELKSMKFSSSSGSEPDSDNEDLSRRMTNLFWCTCSNCSLTSSVAESKWCQESALLQDKLKNLPCITLHADFEILVLHKSVLETAFIRSKKNYNEVKDIASK